MVETICINVFVFICLTLIFESNRFYKQIYLKRLQNRFRVSFYLTNVYMLCLMADSDC